MDKKRLDRLTKIDLINKPVWEHWYVGDLEYVKPSDLIELSETDIKGHIVITEFLLKCGEKLIGFCSPQDNSGIDYIQPVILTDKGQVNLYSDNEWTSSMKVQELKKIGLDWNEVFPIEYKARVKCDGNIYNGIIYDFNKGK
jgi:hypothetical protein